MALFNLIYCFLSISSRSLSRAIYSSYSLLRSYMRISFSSYCLLSFSFSYYSLNLSRLSCSNWLLYPFYKSSLFIGREFVDKSASLLIVPSIVQQKLNVWEGSSEMDLRRYERPRRSPVRTREALLPLLCYCCFYQAQIASWHFHNVFFG